MRNIFVLIVVLFLSSNLNAQVRLNLNFNLDNQPVWGPTGNDYVENYYLPDIEVYYNVPTHRFYYNEGGRWISRSSLPPRFGNYDLYNSYKVVLNEKQPWRNHETYRAKYSSYKGRHDQQVIRDSRDSKYFVNKNHPEHNNWMKQQKHGDVNRNSMKKENNARGNARNKAVKQENNRNKHDNGREQR
jgi:hypothetical protein